MGRQVTILYHQPLLVTVDLDEGIVTKVYEDGDNIQPEMDQDGDLTMWEATDDDQFAAPLSASEELMEAALEVAENNTWPERDSY